MVGVAGRTCQEIFGTINHLLTCKSDLAGSRPQPPNPAKLSKPRRPPRRGFSFLARVVRVIHNYGMRFQVLAKSIEVVRAAQATCSGKDRAILGHRGGATVS